MKIAKNLSVALLLILCGCDGFVGDTTTHPDSTIETLHTPTLSPTPIFTSTPYPEHDAIYFWWWDENKNSTQLWEIAPRGTPNRLYEFAYLPSPEEALNAGLLTENDLKILERGPAINDSSLLFNGERIDITPESLQLSPDRRRIAWHEHVIYYCVDNYTCIYGSIIRVFNIEERKLEISLSIPVELEPFAPVWSPDSKKLAYYTINRETDTINNTIHVLDIDTATTIDIEGGDQDFAWTLEWMPNGNEIVIGNSNGFYVLVLDSREFENIFSGVNWWIFDAVASSNGNSIAFTGIKDVDDPTTPDYPIDNMDSSHQLIYLFDLKTHTLQSVINENKLGWINNVYWLPDGRHLVYTPEQKSQYVIFVRDLISNKVIMTEILPFSVDNDRQLSQLSKDGNKMLFMSSEYQEVTESFKTSLIIYNLNTRAWNKVPLPAEVQNAMDENMKHIRLSLATW